MAMKDNTSEFAARRSRMVKQQFDRHGLRPRAPQNSMRNCA